PHFFFTGAVPPRHLHSFPTRRSSDLAEHGGQGIGVSRGGKRNRPEPNKGVCSMCGKQIQRGERRCNPRTVGGAFKTAKSLQDARSEEHTSELQSRFDLVCRLLLEKKN